MREIYACALRFINTYPSCHLKSQLHHVTSMSVIKWSVSQISRRIFTANEALQIYLIFIRVPLRLVPILKCTPAI